MFFIKENANHFSSNDSSALYLFSSRAFRFNLKCPSNLCSDEARHNYTYAVQQCFSTDLEYYNNRGSLKHSLSQFDITKFMC